MKNRVSFTVFSNTSEGLESKALFGGTPFEVKHNKTFEQFVDCIKRYNTIVPYVPKDKRIKSGYLSTKGGKQYPVFDLNSCVIPDTHLHRTKEHLQDSTSLVCIDFDRHLMLDVYNKLKGKPYKIQPPKIEEVLDLMSTVLRLGISRGTYIKDMSEVNHLLYKSSSYGVNGKSNSHLWLMLNKTKTVKTIKEGISNLFSFVDEQYPQKCIGINKQTRVVCKPLIPDMAVYNVARLLIQGSLTNDRIYSCVTDGHALGVHKFQDSKPVIEHNMYTEEEQKLYLGTRKAYNKIHNIKLTVKQFEERTQRAHNTFKSGVVYADDLVYVDNKPVGTYESFIQSQIQADRDRYKDLFYERTSDITCNISDVLDPMYGKGDSCYLVIRPDNTSQIYHYSEERWFGVLNRSYKDESKVIYIDKYIPVKGIKTYYKNHCIIAPTGSGKTYHVIKKIIHMLRSHSDKTTKVIWTVPDYAALNSIRIEVEGLIPKDVSFKALYAGKDKRDAYFNHQLILVTPDKLHGDMSLYTKDRPSESPMLNTFLEDTTHIDMMKDWSFVVDEVHTVFTNASSSVNQFMYYRILQRELIFHNLLVMSATINEELLPGHHDRKWLSCSHVDSGDVWRVDKYNLKKARRLKVRHTFPWDTILHKDSTALVMSPTPTKAVGVYQELKKVHKDKNILLYLGLPRDSLSKEVQTYPSRVNGRVIHTPYVRPSHEELLKADFVVATALTAGTSLKQAFKYCVVDMVGIPHNLECLSVEIQKISRARHSDVQPILVISPTRFDRASRRPYTPLVTLPDDMHYLDYSISQRLGLNINTTSLLTPQAYELKEEGMFTEASKLHTPQRAVFDVLKEVTEHYINEDKRLSQSRATYEGEWGLGFTASFDSTASVEMEEDERGKDHAKQVRWWKQCIKKMTPTEFMSFMNTPPADAAVDKAQQDTRKIVVPDTPTCDPSIGLLPNLFIADAGAVVTFTWAPPFKQRMHQDPSLAKKAIAQNELFCNAQSKFLLTLIKPNEAYVLSDLRSMLSQYITQEQASTAVALTGKEPRLLLERLGRVIYYEVRLPSKHTPHKINSKVLESYGTQLSRFSKHKANYFTFRLGWFDLDDPSIIQLPQSVKTPHI